MSKSAATTLVNFTLGTNSIHFLLIALLIGAFIVDAGLLPIILLS